MPQMEAMTDAEVQQALKALPEWKHQDNAIVRTTTFPGFLRGVEFVNAVAHLAERQDHHPDIEIQYHRVTIRYWTHRAKGVTHLDFDGAKEVEAMIPVFKKEPVVSA